MTRYYIDGIHQTKIAVFKRFFKKFISIIYAKVSPAKGIANLKLIIEELGAR